MRDFGAENRLRIRSLAELDALIGERVTNENPVRQWEDSHTQLRFGSVEEAFDAMDDPFVQQLIPRDSGKTTVLTEIKEFRRYSSDLSVAWDVVEQLSAEGGESLQVRRHDTGWVASFGREEPATAPTAPLAICLAALWARGIEVDYVGTRSVSGG